MGEGDVGRGREEEGSNSPRLNVLYHTREGGREEERVSGREKMRGERK